MHFMKIRRGRPLRWSFMGFVGAFFPGLRSLTPTCPGLKQATANAASGSRANEVPPTELSLNQETLVISIDLYHVSPAL
jgi:hypothetical protein